MEQAAQTSFPAQEKQPMPESRGELSFGEKAVGITFNPGKDQFVNDVKEQYARIIDKLNSARATTDNPEKKRMFSLAITELQSSQMWAVKAATWQY